jgi:hypothetical protein
MKAVDTSQSARANNLSAVLVTDARESSFVYGTRKCSAVVWLNTNEKVPVDYEMTIAPDYAHYLLKYTVRTVALPPASSPAPATNEMQKESPVSVNVDGLQKKLVGNWMVSVERDHFSGENILRATAYQKDKRLGVRCKDHVFSLGLYDPSHRYTIGDHFQIKFRAGDNPVVNADGEAVDVSTILVRAQEPISRELLTAKEFAFRVITASTSVGGFNDLVFDAGSAAEALPEVIDACQK